MYILTFGFICLPLNLKQLKHLQLFSMYIVKSVKTHFYYSIKNCDGSGEKLKKNLLNIVNHYKVLVKWQVHVHMES